MILECLLLAITFSILLYLFSTYHGKSKSGHFPPGPKGLPIVGYMPFLLPLPHVEIGKLGKKYGNIFHIMMGSNKFVVLNDYDTIRDALRKLEFAGRPTHLIAFDMISKGIGLATGTEALEQRKFGIKTLHKLGLGSPIMENSVHEEVQNLVDYFSGQVGKPVDLTDTIGIAVVNSIWCLVAGKKYSLQEEMPKQLFNLIKNDILDTYSNTALLFPTFTKMFPNLSGYNRLWKTVEHVKTIFSEFIDDHNASFDPMSSPKDYIDAFLQEMHQCNDPNSGFSKEKARANLLDSLINFFAGGSDTVTSTVMFAILYLLKSPEILKKLVKEIDTVAGNKTILDFGDRLKMPFTEAVIQETYRMSSVLPSSVLHCTTKDVHFMGYDLPKDTIILPNLYQVHYDENYWRDPNTFRPHRFLNEDGSFRKDERVVPFSIGKRHCIGDVLGNSEVFMFLTGLLRNFEIKPDPQCPLPDINDVRPGLVLSPQLYKVVLERRSF